MGHPDTPARRTADGLLAERLAARYLEASGLEILERRVRLGGGELDLIARDGETIVFVEVRARRASARFSPLSTIGPVKRRRLAAAAQAWLVRRALPAGRCRFDVVTVAIGRRQCRLRHVPHAFVDEG